MIGTEIGTRYRYIDDTPLVPLTEAGKANGTNSSASASGAKTRSRASSEYVLYSHGVPAAVNSDEGTSYFGTDILGSVRNVTDKYGAEQSSYDYDAFGSPYLGNLDNGMSFGYTGKAYDAGTGLYDYGFRDYSPNNARFTTVDPIRDGSNWFSYVVNDPVNYIDPFGLYVVNNSDSPIIIKLESDGYVILASGATYDGRNVADFPYGNENSIDNGKIDGIIFADGRIKKVSGKSWLPTISLIINRDKSVDFADIQSIITNSISDGVKALANVGIKFVNLIIEGINKIAGEEVVSPKTLKEYSRKHYKANDGTKTGEWCDDQLSESAMKDTLNGSDAVFIKSKDDLNKMLIPDSSGINNSTTDSNIIFSNLSFDNSGNFVLSPKTDFSTRANSFAKYAFNINPFNSFSGGCTK